MSPTAIAITIALTVITVFYLWIAFYKCYAWEIWRKPLSALTIVDVEYLKDRLSEAEHKHFTDYLAKATREQHRSVTVGEVMKGYTKPTEAKRNGF